MLLFYVSRIPAKFKNNWKNGYCYNRGFIAAFKNYCYLFEKVTVGKTGWS